MISLALLQPAVVLIGWTLVMLGWMLATRLPAMRRAGIRMGSLVGSRAADADRSLPAEAQWKAHNYNHLLEQPVLFYALCGILTLAGRASPAAIALAWAYVALRVAHSLVQATSNRVKPRFILFAVSSGCLVLLTLVAGLAVIRAG